MEEHRASGVYCFHPLKKKTRPHCAVIFSTVSGVSDRAKHPRMPSNIAGDTSLSTSIYHFNTVNSIEAQIAFPFTAACSPVMAILSKTWCDRREWENTWITGNASKTQGTIVSPSVHAATGQGLFTEIPRRVCRTRRRLIFRRGASERRGWLLGRWLTYVDHC